MSSATVDSNGDGQRHNGIFYRCEDADGCGLRFPVTATDPFLGRCPRCGGTVAVVARVEDDARDTPLAADHLGNHATNIHLLLDNWRSLFNVGAAFRTADDAGVRHLYLCGITATPELQPKLTKTALGAERDVAWSYHADAVRFASELQARGAQLWVLERSDDASSLFDITNVPNDCLVVLAAGNEVIGVDPALVAMADRVVQLPMLGSKHSLNVAVALSVATYWLTAHVDANAQKPQHEAE